MRWAWIFLGSVLAASTAGCRSPSPRAPEEIKPPEVRAEPAFFAVLDLRPEQREQLLDLVERLTKDFTEYDRLRLVLLDEAIVQIRSGQLDEKVLRPMAEDAVKAYEAALPSGISAAQQLHDMLDRKQREKFVAFYSGDEDVSDEERREAREESVGRALDLTAAQKAQIYPGLFHVYITNMGVLNGARSALADARAAFIEDDFVAADQAIFREMDLMKLGELLFEALVVVCEELTPAQRETLAALLDARLRSPRSNTPETKSGRKAQQSSPSPTK